MFKIFKNKNHFNLAKKLFGVIFVCIFFLMPVVPAASTLIAPAKVSAQGGADIRSDMQSRAQLQGASDTTTTSTKTNEPGLLEKGFSIALGGMVTGLGTMVIGISSALLWMSAEVFEVVINKSIIGLHNYIGPTSAVAAVWQTLRDIGNMFFIFILVYTAVMTVLGLSDSKIKSIITKVVIFAILINFSFFFTKVAIDASNIVSVAFYNQIVQTRCGVEGGNGQAVGNIGTAFMCHLGITSFFDNDVLALVADTQSSGMSGVWKILQFSIMASAFILITAFVFAAAALMFVVRFVTLIILLATSPLAFASMAFPKDKYSSMWSDPLVNNCILAPVYMFATWVVLKLLQGVTGGNSSLLKAILGNQDGSVATGAGDALLSFVAVIAMMVATLWVASKFGGYGAKGAMKSLAGAQGWVQGKIGRGVVRATGIATLDNKFKESNFGNSRFGRELRKVTTGYVAGQKFGSGQSVASYDKELKKEDKKSAEQIVKNTIKEAGVRAEREGKDAELQERLLQQVRGNIERENKKLKNLEFLYTAGGTDLEPEIEKQKNIISGLESQEADRKNKYDRAVSGIGATKEEKEQYVKDQTNTTLKKLEQGEERSKKFATGFGKFVGGTAGIGIGSVSGPAGSVVGLGVGSQLGKLWGKKLGGDIDTVSFRKALIDQLKEELKPKDDKSKNEKKKAVDVDEVIENPEKIGLDEDTLHALAKKLGYEKKKEK